MSVKSNSAKACLELPRISMYFTQQWCHNKLGKDGAHNLLCCAEKCAEVDANHGVKKEPVVRVLVARAPHCGEAVALSSHLNLVSTASNYLKKLSLIHISEPTRRTP